MFHLGTPWRYPLPWPRPDPRSASISFHNTDHGTAQSADSVGTTTKSNGFLHAHDTRTVDILCTGLAKLDDALKNIFSGFAMPCCVPKAILFVLSAQTTRTCRAWAKLLQIIEAAE